MIEAKNLTLLQFEKIQGLVRDKCHGEIARERCSELLPKADAASILPELQCVQELAFTLQGGGFFPSVEHEDIRPELIYLQREGSQLQEDQLLSLLKSLENVNSVLRFIKSKKALMPQLWQMADPIQIHQTVCDAINAVIDHEGEVKDQASPELHRIRREIQDKKRESDRRFYQYIAQVRKEGYLRENEEGFYNGRRTLAVLVEYKSEVQGFVHGKSETGKTIFIEPGATMSINNDIAELHIDERRELNRILRELCQKIRPFSAELRIGFDFLTHIDFVRAKALLAVDLKATLPQIKTNFSLQVKDAYHPLLYLQNKRAGKSTVSLSLNLNKESRILVISGPNAGGKTIALKTIGLLQIMLQSGLLVPVNESSEFCFFDDILIDIGDTQSIENELSTYSAKLKSMTSILEKVNESTLVLMDEFGSGTDPELGSAIAEAVLESLVNSQTRGIITSHFGNVKLLADNLVGAFNGSMLFDLEHLDPLYILSVGEPGSSYTFEVAERVGFPKHIIERARQKVDKDKLKLNQLLAEVQSQKAKLADQQERLEQEIFLSKIAKEKYHTLFKQWEEKILRERDRKLELVRQADFGQKYLRLMDDWIEKKDRKEVIKRFIDGITAETKRQDLLKKQKKVDAFAVKKIARIKSTLQIGSKVRVLNGNEVGEVESIKEEKVLVRFGLHKITVGMQNLMLAEEA